MWIGSGGLSKVKWKETNRGWRQKMSWLRFVWPKLLASWRRKLVTIVRFLIGQNLEKVRTKTKK